ncbi:integral membrane sensor signal transduction histidine kinase [Methylobacterium sp. 4-46]|uniref:sensor histidine kinase n=1 Tax=unclassified Methylobacterium TaxID=2615210 RepID=UPI000152CC85|nr:MULTISPECIES: ATP-binding protein [Methylobacterium]ACA15487.1 integral membrane sensor signal transduction histidine kinase [Methylobacterium sp. 4-46]WFT81205.1 ATP-binding protein [Methylobacterium nodulans]
MERRRLQRVVRAWPIRWRILGIAGLNSALALVLIGLIWDGATVLSRAWNDLRQVRQSEHLLGQLDRDTERLQSLIHRSISQDDPDMLWRIGDLRDTLIGRLRVQARLDPLIARPSETLREVTERFIAGFSALRETRARISQIYEGRLAGPAREMSGLYALIEGSDAAGQAPIGPPLSKSRESFHAMMLAANAFSLSAAEASAAEVRRAAAAIRGTVPVMRDRAATDVQSRALDALDARAQAVEAGVAALTAEFAAQGRLLKEEIDGNADRMTASIEAMGTHVRAVEQAAQARFDRTLESAALKLGGVALAFVALVAALGTLVARSISDPLRGLSGAMLAIAGGDYARKVPGAEARDEIGDMAAAVAVFRENALARLRAEAELRRAKEQAEAALAELRETQASLIEAEKLAALGGLVAGVAHEVNNPVGISLTVASTLSQRCEAFAADLAGGPLRRSQLTGFIEAVQEASKQLVANLMRAGDLVQSFKQVAVDRSQDNRRRFDLGETCAQIIASLRPELRTARIALALDLPPGLVMESFPGPLGQVLTNLFLNAVRHGFPDGRAGTIRLAAEPLGSDRVVLTFSDDGVGMSEEVARRAFEPFFTTRRDSGGTGLGLHLAFNIVTHQLGGRITLHAAPGAGSRFVLTLPLVAPVQEPGRKRQAA